MKLNDHHRLTSLHVALVLAVLLVFACASKKKNPSPSSATQHVDELAFSRRANVLASTAEPYIQEEENPLRPRGGRSDTITSSKYNPEVILLKIVTMSLKHLLVMILLKHVLKHASYYDSHVF